MQKLRAVGETERLDTSEIEDDPRAMRLVADLILTLASGRTDSILRLDTARRPPRRAPPRDERERARIEADRTVVITIALSRT